ncbi:hypothetical protein [Bacillus manliponensis]|uniref:hypothetical protein n=1 Tax=Bacillus manliponensis TaxID=574376 RepID=UPI00351280E5
MCSSGQCLFLPRALLQQMDEMSTFVILIYVAAIFVLNGQVGYILHVILNLLQYCYEKYKRVFTC